MFPNEHGVDTLYVLVKASFHMGGKLTLLDEQIPITEADVYYGDPEISSLKYASELHTGKPTTDIIMNGMACAPNSTSVHQLDVSLSIGSYGKTVRVFGDRKWVNGKPTRPEPFITMPMIYENAFGGMHYLNGMVDTADQRNPVGKGYSGKSSIAEMNGIHLPNLESPAELIRSPTDMPMPACFGFVSPGWEPRITYAGTYDEVWQSNRAPYLPVDFNSRFFNMAHPDVVCDGYLTGGEPVFISGMHPAGDIRFNLPLMTLHSSITVDRKKFHPKFNLETVLLEPNKLQTSMSWRAAFPCDRKLLKIERVSVSLKR